MFCLLVVLVKLSVHAKWLAWKTALRKPFCHKEIISTKPRPKGAYDFFGLVYCFIVLLCVCLLHDISPTPMAGYSLFVPLITNQPLPLDVAHLFLPHSGSRNHCRGQPKFVFIFVDENEPFNHFWPSLFLVENNFPFLDLFFIYIPKIFLLRTKMIWLQLNVLTPNASTEARLSWLRWFVM